MQFQTFQAVLDARADGSSDATLYRLHMVINGIWFAFKKNTDPYARVHWYETKEGTQFGDVLTRNQALQLIVSDIHDFWMPADFQQDEKNQLAGSYKLISVESSA